MNTNPSHITFAELDKQKGISNPATSTEEEYPLPSWYRSIREVPLNKLGVEDIGKACRQKMHLEHVVPLALELLEANPLEGEMYDGELLVSLKGVPRDYWSVHVDDKSLCLGIIEKVIDALPEDVVTDANELLSYVK